MVSDLIGDCAFPTMFRRMANHGALALVELSHRSVTAPNCLSACPSILSITGSLLRNAPHRELPPALLPAPPRRLS